MKVQSFMVTRHKNATNATKRRKMRGPQSFTKEIRVVSAMISGKKEHIAQSSMMVVKFSKKVNLAEL